MALATHLDRILQPLGEAMDRDTAARVVAMRADDVVQQRIDELAGKATEAELTDDERDEYDSYLHAIDIVSILQSKARQILARGDC
jgi:hypothetical protein